MTDIGILEAPTEPGVYETTVKAKKLPPPPYKVASHPCGFCQTGHHLPTEANPMAQCVGAVANYPEGIYQVFRCSCTCAGNRPRCFNCNTRYSEEEAQAALTSMWTCVDIEGCQARIARRRKSNPALALIDQIMEEREMPTATKTKSKTKTATAAKPTTGKCRCCDGATKGGNFLPGHDARYVSQFVEAVQAKHTTAAKVKAELKGISDALVGKFEKSLAQSQAKAEKAKAAEKAASGK